MNQSVPPTEPEGDLGAKGYWASHSQGRAPYAEILVHVPPEGDEDDSPTDISLAKVIKVHKNRPNTHEAAVILSFIAKLP